MKCFNHFEKNKVKCTNKNCKYFIENNKSFNCTVISAKKGPITLEEIGNIFGVTRMRICQIEKAIMRKIMAKLKIYEI